MELGREAQVASCLRSVSAGYIIVTIGLPDKDQGFTCPKKYHHAACAHGFLLRENWAHLQANLDRIQACSASQDIDEPRRVSSHFRFWRTTGEADGDFGPCRVVMTQGSGKSRRGLLSRKDLRAENGTLPPVDIFRTHAPVHPPFSALQRHRLKPGTDLPKPFRVRVAFGPRHPHFPHRDPNQRPDLLFISFLPLSDHRPAGLQHGPAFARPDPLERTQHNITDYRMIIKAVPLQVEQAQLDSRVDVGRLIVEMGKPL